MLLQERVDLAAGRRTHAAAEARAFERGRGGSEAKALRFTAALSERERKGGVKYVKLPSS